MSMQNDKRLLDLMASLSLSYDGVTLRGEGKAKFIRICKDRRSAVISECDEGWFVELWSVIVPDCEEEEMLDEVVEREEDVINRIVTWLDM